jgi:hypothetical protein
MFPSIAIEAQRNNAILQIPVIANEFASEAIPSKCSHTIRRLLHTAKDYFVSKKQKLVEHPDGSGQ